MKITLIRHGKTKGNLLKKYIGSTDEPLCEEGINELELFDKNHTLKSVYVTPLIRTKQTASILFPSAKHTELYEMREMDFGIFEGKNHKELESSKEYEKWLSTMCEDACPNGEKKADFSKRCCLCFEEIVEKELRNNTPEIAFVVHGGTVMSICSCFAIPEKSYFDWNPKNGEKLVFFTDSELWKNKKMRRI